MPPFSRLIVPARLLEEVIDHARATLPNECCGLLAGYMDSDTAEATTGLPIGNDAASPRQYLTNGRDLLAAFRAIRVSGLELQAIYHSHPGGEPVPSARDLQENTYGETVVHLIVGLGSDPPAVRAWWLTETSYREVELSLD